MIVVHHLENSRSQRIIWLLEELGLPYEVRRYARAKTMAAPPELRKIHPLGKSPIIEDDGVVIAETGAIIEEIVDKAGGRLGRPSEPENARRYRYFMHYAEGSAMTALLMWMIVGYVPIFGKRVQKHRKSLVNNHLDFIESELAMRPWFAGDAFTAADVMMSFPIEFAAARADGLDGRPKTAAWLKTIRARPAYQAALEVGGPYAFG